jgi:hypothetical protein
VRSETKSKRNETERNETKSNKTKRNRTKRNETKRNITSFRFASLDFVSFRFDRFRFVSFRFVWFRFVSFGFVSFRFYFVSHFTGTLHIVTFCPTYIRYMNQGIYIYILWLLVLPTYMLSKNISCDFLSARVKNIDCDFLSCDFLTCDFLSVYRFNYHKSLMQIIVFHGSTWNFNKIDIWFSYISSNKWDIIYTIHKW